MEHKAHYHDHNGLSLHNTHKFSLHHVITSLKILFNISLVCDYVTKWSNPRLENNLATMAVHIVTVATSRFSSARARNWINK